MNNWQEWVVGVLIVLCIARSYTGFIFFFVARAKALILAIAV